MRVIEGGFEVVTPLFLGGAEKEAKGIRPSSIKGALRFWWRALNWSRCLERSGSTELALQQLHIEEQALFGSAAAEGASSGQSRVLIRCFDAKRADPSRDPVICEKGKPIIYLLGQGLYSHNSGLRRDYIPAGATFKVQFALKNSVTEEQYHGLVEAIWCLGLLGTLGSRARKGFGSITLHSLELPSGPAAVPETPRAYTAKLKELVSSIHSSVEPPFSAFSKNALLQTVSSELDARELLNSYGNELALYRGYGRNGIVFGQEAEMNFSDDHDWAYEVANGKATDNIPRRTVFGLPHPYRLSKGENVAVDVKLDGPSATGRRASPLLAHIHKLPDGKCVLALLLLPSTFLPEAARVEVKSRGSKPNVIKAKQVNDQLDWDVIREFLGRFEGREVIDV